MNTILLVQGDKDVFHSQKVHVSNALWWSRHMAAESRSPAEVPAAPISTDDGHSNSTFHSQVHVDNRRQWSRHVAAMSRSPANVCLASVSIDERQSNFTEFPDIAIYLAECDLGRAKKKRTVREDGEHLQDQHEAHPETIHAETLEDVDDLAALKDEMAETGEIPKEKSNRRRMLNWLDGVIHNHYRRKITKTYRREQEEGHTYVMSCMTNFVPVFYPKTRAEREQEKRERYVAHDNLRQNIKGCLDIYWEDNHQQKEALRTEEEGCFEKWAAKHGISSPPPGQPKKRLSLWEKRCLNATDFLFK